MSLGDSSQTTVRLTYEQMRDTLGRFGYFRHWTEDQIRECSILARVVQYAPHQTIPLELPLPFTYLVVSGQCMILQCLQLARDTYHLASSQEDAKSPTPPLEPMAPEHQLETVRHLHKTYSTGALVAQPDSIRYDPDNAVCFLKTPPQQERFAHHFVDVGTLRCGAVFGLGERHHHRTIVARTRTQCLLIPRCWLFLKAQNIGNTWQRLRMYLDCTVPGRDALYERFLRDQAWLAYRQRVEAELAHQYTGTVRADVPVMCRLLESTTFGKLEKHSHSALK